MFSVHFLPTAANFCSQTQNLGNCRGPDTQYPLGRFDIPTTENNPNGEIPTDSLWYTAVYFKYGFTQNLNSTRNPTYFVKFDNNSNKWSCTCIDFTSRRSGLGTCCKHIQGCIDLRAAFDRFNDDRYLDLLGDHLINRTEEEYNNMMAE
jgi:hypothetical protein